MERRLFSRWSGSRVNFAEFVRQDNEDKERGGREKAGNEKEGVGEPRAKLSTAPRGYFLALSKASLQMLLATTTISQPHSRTLVSILCQRCSASLQAALEETRSSNLEDDALNVYMSQLVHGYGKGSVIERFKHTTMVQDF